MSRAVILPLICSTEGDSTMAMTRCSHGHFYDAEKHSACPYCGVGADIVEEKTRRVSDRVGAPVAPAARVVAAPISPAADPGVTRAVFRDASTGISPVVGWLVCVEGPDKGRDFRIHSEKNFIGRSPAMDIAVTGDESVSREKHASDCLRSQTARLLDSAGRGRGPRLSQRANDQHADETDVAGYRRSRQKQVDVLAAL